MCLEGPSRQRCVSADSYQTPETAKFQMMALGRTSTVCPIGIQTTACDVQQDRRARLCKTASRTWKQTPQTTSLSRSSYQLGDGCVGLTISPPILLIWTANQGRLLRETSVYYTQLESVFVCMILCECRQSLPCSAYVVLSDCNPGITGSRIPGSRTIFQSRNPGIQPPSIPGFRDYKNY